MRTTPTAVASLPPLLRVEAALAALAVGLGPVPWVVLDATALQPPMGAGAVWLLAAASLGLLWLVLLAHLLADGWELLRDGLDRFTGRGRAHVAFRVVESLGVLAVPAALQVVAAGTPGGADASGAAVGGLIVVAGVIAALAVVVLLHAGWLLGTGRAPLAAANDPA